MADEPNPNPTADTPNPGAAPPAPGGVADAPPRVEAKERPESIPEQFWDADNGGLKSEFFTHYAEMTAAEKARQEAAAKFPAKVEEYKIELSPELKGPDGQPLKIDEANPDYQAFRAFAFDKKIDPAVATELMGLYAKQTVERAGKIQKRLDEEKAKLGPNITTRIDAMDKALVAHVGADGAKAITDSLFTAAAITAFETLITKVINGGAAPLNGSTHDDAAAPRPAPLMDRMFPNRKGI